jgi:hypothetical protein
LINGFENVIQGHGRKGLLSSGKIIEHASMHGTDLSNAENAESMMLMFVGLPAEVITQRYMKISPNSFALHTSRKTLKRKIVRWHHYMAFRNITSLFRIDVCWLRMSFRDW